MLEDNIRIRIPEDLKQKFKESRPHGKMTDLLKGVIVETLEGQGRNLAKMAKKPPRRESKIGVGVRTKYYQEKLQKADSYIRFLIDTETKERFKLYCHLIGTTMSDYLREAIEDVLQEEAVVVEAPKVRHLAPVAQVPTGGEDIGEMWSRMFGSLCA